MNIDLTYEVPEGVETQTLKEVGQIVPTNGFLYVLDAKGHFLWGTDLTRVIRVERVWTGVAPTTDTTQ